MLGGGVFVTQNKTLPGSYINLVSASSGISVFGERGTGVLLLPADYGTDDIVSLTASEFNNSYTEIIGTSSVADNEAYLAINDFFLHGSRLYLATLASDKEYATCSYATATHWGTGGNSLMIAIERDVDNEAAYTVSTYCGAKRVDKQTVVSAAELTDNAYVVFNKSAELKETAGVMLTGGKSEPFDGEALSVALGKLESYSFNAVGLLSKDASMNRLLVEWTKRMRDEVGLKMQCVIYDGEESVKADYEGCVRLKNRLAEGDYMGVAWVTGAVAGAEVNESLTNTVFDSGLTVIDESHTQTELEDCIANGLFTLHRVGDDWRVLLDINSLTEVSEDKGEIFKDNQTVRVCDRIATDIAELFNTYYLGKVPNDEAGRSPFKSDIAREHSKLADLRAIEDFDSEDITVMQGEKKGSVVVTDCICIASTMDILYMTVRVE
jgi:hypothetical protein